MAERARGRKAERQEAHSDESIKQTPEFNATEFNRFVDEAARQQKYVSEYSGNIGSLTKGYCERSGMGRKAVTHIRGIDKLEPAKQLAHLRDLLRLAHARGMFAQADAFDDTATILRSILNDLERATPPATSNSDTLNAVLN